MKKILSSILGVLAAVAIVMDICAASAATTRNTATEEANKAVVVEFYNKLFTDKDFDGARKYFGDRYIQHNPNAPDGPDALQKFLTGFWQKYPNARSEIKRVVADGDLVVLHVHAVPEPGDAGVAIVDIFRLDAGKVVEHWDVVQKIPPTAANNNTMF